jgi:alpha-beta hydrolase superfamily lysophospholipase
LWKILLFSLLLLLLASHWFADRLIFPAIPASYRMDHRHHLLADGRGGRVVMRYLSNPAASRLILYSHGNAEDLGLLEPLLQHLYREGFSVLAYDYPGYGLSSGKPTEASCVEALRLVARFAREQLGYPGERILLYGRSVGAGPSIVLASEGSFSGLVIEGAFLSAFHVAIGTDVLPWDRFRNLRRIADVRCPVLVLHGTRDEVVPFSHGERLFRAASEPKWYYWAEGAGHQDVPAFMGSDFAGLLREFPDSWLAASGE